MPSLTSSARNHGRENSGRAASQCTWNIFPLVKYLTLQNSHDVCKPVIRTRPTITCSTVVFFVRAKALFCSRNRQGWCHKIKDGFRPSKIRLHCRLGQPKVSLLFGPACSRLQYSNAHRSWKLSEFSRGLGRERVVTAPLARSWASFCRLAFPLSESLAQDSLSTHPLLPPTGWPHIRGGVRRKDGWHFRLLSFWGNCPSTPPRS